MGPLKKLLKRDLSCWTKNSWTSFESVVKTIEKAVGVENMLFFFFWKILKKLWLCWTKRLKTLWVCWKNCGNSFESGEKPVETALRFIS
jgi:hypothetical protein